MLNKARGVVLHSIPYSDTYSIIHIYTDTFGRIACLHPRRKGKQRLAPGALLMPLAVVEMEMECRSRHGLFRLREARLCFPLAQLLANPLKSAQALFLAEILFRVLRAAEPDSRLFEFLYRSVLLLENAGEGIANFHLVFLLRLLGYLGVSPNMDSYREGAYFDMRNGIFASCPPLHKDFLNKTESHILAGLARIRYENMARYTFSRRERVIILQKIIDYCRLHLPEITEIKSLAVLQTLFD